MRTLDIVDWAVSLGLYVFLWNYLEPWQYFVTAIGIAAQRIVVRADASEKESRRNYQAMYATHSDSLISKAEAQ